MDFAAVLEPAQSEAGRISRGGIGKNDQLGKVEQYSQDPRDLGTMPLDAYTEAMGDIFESLLPLLKPKGHCVINVPDMWWENQRITIHVSLIEELRRRRIRASEHDNLGSDEHRESHRYIRLAE